MAFEASSTTEEACFSGVDGGARAPLGRRNQVLIVCWPPDVPKASVLLTGYVVSRHMDAIPLQDLEKEHYDIVPAALNEGAVFAQEPVVVPRTNPTLSTGFDHPQALVELVVVPAARKITICAVHNIGVVDGVAHRFFSALRSPTLSAIAWLMKSRGRFSN